MQFDVENFVIKAVNPYTKQEEEVIGGEFGRILRHEILGINPRRERLGVDHIELKTGIPGFAEDKFKLTINDRFFDLILAEDFGRPDKGFEKWGVLELTLKQLLEDRSKRLRKKRLFIDTETIDGKKKFVAYYVHTILNPDGTVAQVIEVLKFIQGKPNPIPQS